MRMRRLKSKGLRFLMDTGKTVLVLMLLIPAMWMIFGMAVLVIVVE